MSGTEILAEVGPWIESLLRAIFFTLAAALTVAQVAEVGLMLRSGRGKVDMPWFPWACWALFAWMMGWLS